VPSDIRIKSFGCKFIKIPVIIQYPLNPPNGGLYIGSLNI
jgi:hypothetical protein